MPKKMDRNDLAAILECKLVQMFPASETRSEVMELLQSYGLAEHEREPERVHLAILKLAEATGESIRRYTEFARQDYRDVLAWAECPNQVKAGPSIDPALKQRLSAMDRAQYQAWLNEDRE
jgi:hypothetical protein